MGNCRRDRHAGLLQSPMRCVVFYGFSQLSGPAVPEESSPGREHPKLTMKNRCIFSRSSFPCFEKSFLCQGQLCLSDSSLELLLGSCAIRILTTTPTNKNMSIMSTWLRKHGKEVKPQTAPFPWTLRTCRFLACCPDHRFEEVIRWKTREIWSWKRHVIVF